MNSPLAANVVTVVCGLAFAVVSQSPLIAQDAVGRPNKFAQGTAVVCAVWFEDGWWVIRTTTDTKGGNRQFDARHTFTGRVRIEGGRVAKYDVDSTDKAKKARDADFITRKPNGFDFKFVNFGGIDGMKFKASEDAKTVTFSIKVDGDDDPKKIIIGGKGIRPEKATFTYSANPEYQSK